MAAPILSGSRPAHNRKSVPAGTVFGKLSVVEEVEKRAGHRYFRLRCACGGTAVVCLPNLRTGHTKTCGCEKGSRRHGWAGTPTHDIWIGMRTRCINPNDTSFRNYGGRGISVDPRWNDFEAFLADMGERPPGMDLDRIDNSGDYEPGNCRWVTRSTNLRNTRRTCVVQLEGVCMSVSEAAEKLGMPRATIFSYVFWKGVSHQQAVDHYAAKHGIGPR
jgi:hypothetical protein